MTWLIFGIFRRRLGCLRGMHYGNNFCATCGKQLVVTPFFPFRVESLDGELSQVVEALNSNHAKSHFRGTYAREKLKAQRLASNRPDMEKKEGSIWVSGS
jgi:hypothetical protein